MHFVCSLVLSCCLKVRCHGEAVLAFLDGHPVVGQCLEGLLDTTLLELGAEGMQKATLKCCPSLLHIRAMKRLLD